MILFGSLVAGIPTPRSDADILVIVESAEPRSGRDYLPEVLAVMSPLPCPVDLYVLTVEEFAAARERGEPLLREALTNGIDLLV